jgi:hypothetical protein
MRGMAEAKRRGGREAEYRGLVAKQARSGLSVREFAEREGIAVQTFYWWRSELRRRDRAASSRGGEPGFVRVSVKPSPAQWVSSGEGFDVQLPGGIVVRVPSRFEESALAKLLGLIRRSC